MDKIKFTEFDSTSLLKKRFEEHLNKVGSIKFPKSVNFVIRKRKYECTSIEGEMLIMYNRVGDNFFRGEMTYKGLTRSQLIKLMRSINSL